MTNCDGMQHRQRNEILDKSSIFGNSIHYSDSIVVLIAIQIVLGCIVFNCIYIYGEGGKNVFMIVVERLTRATRAVRPSFDEPN